ncbi:MAG: hypothetical protein AAF701_03705 [Pseudomonadota bacterium]
MTHSWILDVLDDLKKYAKLNDLSALADHLDDTAVVAQAEFASKQYTDHKMGMTKVAPDVHNQSLSEGAR